MNKIGIVTLHGGDNFGNMLQSYAVQKYLERYSYVAETIIDIPIIRSVVRKIKQIIKTLLGKSNSKNKKSDVRRHKNFELFRENNLKEKNYYSWSGVYPKMINKRYSFFVIGSDQVWHTSAMKYKHKLINRFLLFAKTEKKLCFSPSISMDSIQDEYKDKYTKCLNTFPEINVRERRGAEIIEELTGKKAEVFIDPTLMLTKEEWEEVSSKSVGQGKKYILEYFLGECSGKDNEILEKYSKDGLERINVLDMNNPDAYASGPAEFIDLVKNAKLVYTDSFHACVFSIIFDTPFIIKRRDDNLIDMFSRIETLFELFEIDKQCIEKSVPVVVDNVKKEEILSREREKVNRYFNKYLGN